MIKTVSKEGSILQTEIYWIKFSKYIKMVKDMSIKNRSYYFFIDMIALKDFDEANLKVDKKYYKHIDIYYIGYITIKKVDDYGNIHSINLLCLIIHSAIGYFTEENDNKYLILDSTNKYEEVWFGIRAEIKEFKVEKNFFTKKTTLELKLIMIMIYHWIKHWNFQHWQ